MAKDHLERRTYRKSPGRQYGYDYDPLRSQGGQSRSGSQHGETMSKSGALMAQRPDPRRTRQLMRQSIIASKRANEEETESIDFLADEQYLHPSQELYEEENGYDEETEDMSDRRIPSRSGRRYVSGEAGESLAATPSVRRQGSRAGRFADPTLPHTSELLPSEEEYIDDTYNQYNPNDWQPLAVGSAVEVNEPARSR
ncbi:MAG: hypothetical protein H0U76_23985, partial [Ktedonobacteraceae bacterium]|nr:hypothetical protein [Ktedonobacteraceae bacterium]